MDFALENVIDIKSELEPIIKLHWEQIALNKDKIKLNPDWNQYKLLEDAGILKLYTVRDGTELVGYFCVVMAMGLHYADHVMAACDVLYVKPDKRAGLTGYKLIAFVEKELKKLNVSVLAINTKVHAPFDKLMERMNYKCTERLYQKYIGK